MRHSWCDGGSDDERMRSPEREYEIVAMMGYRVAKTHRIP